MALAEFTGLIKLTKRLSNPSYVKQIFLMRDHLYLIKEKNLLDYYY